MWSDPNAPGEKLRQLWKKRRAGHCCQVGLSNGANCQSKNNWWCAAPQDCRGPHVTPVNTPATSQQTATKGVVLEWGLQGMQSNPSVLISVKTLSSILQRALNTIPAHTHTEGKKKKVGLKLQQGRSPWHSEASTSNKREMFLPAVTPYSLEGLQGGKGGGWRLSCCSPESWAHTNTQHWQSRAAGLDLPEVPPTPTALPPPRRAHLNSRCICYKSIEMEFTSSLSIAEREKSPAHFLILLLTNFWSVTQLKCSMRWQQLHWVWYRCLIFLLSPFKKKIAFHWKPLTPVLETHYRFNS